MPCKKRPPFRRALFDARILGILWELPLPVNQNPVQINKIFPNGNKTVKLGKSVPKVEQTG